MCLLTRVYGCTSIVATKCIIHAITYNYTDDEADANHVFMAIKNKAAVYNHIGRYFGLAPSTIESIKENHPGDNAGALQDVINTWIRQDYNTERFGLPSWRKVVEAISNQGDNLQAKKIAKSHPIKPTGMITVKIFVQRGCYMVQKLKLCRFDIA